MLTISHFCRDKRALGITTVAIYSKSDVESKHVTAADEAVLLDGPDSTAYTDG